MATSAWQSSIAPKMGKLGLKKTQLKPEASLWRGPDPLLWLFGWPEQMDKECAPGCLLPALDHTVCVCEQYGHFPTPASSWTTLFYGITRVLKKLLIAAIVKLIIAPLAFFNAQFLYIHLFTLQISLLINYPPSQPYNKLNKINYFSIYRQHSITYIFSNYI